MSRQIPASKTTDAHRTNLRLQVEEHPLVDDQSFPSMEAYVTHLIHVKAYEEASRLAADKAVVDVGCNVGYGLHVLATTATSVAGIDVSPQAVEAAQRRLGSSADIRLYDGARCSFGPCSFDVVTSFQVIEHVSDYEAYFSEIVRLVRPDGLVVFTTPNAQIRLFPGMRPWNEFHVREFTPPELRELLSRWFDSVEIRGLFGKDELYAIERNRVESAKAGARSWSAWLRSLLRRSVKRVISWVLPERSARRIRAQREENRAGLDPSEIARFSTRDLFYKSDSLDEALDLMAICRGRIRARSLGRNPPHPAVQERIGEIDSGEDI